MGYDVRITRTPGPGGGKTITAAEWLAYVAGDAELRPMPENGPYFVSWSGDPVLAWLDWFDGQIHSKYPAPALIDKMVAIAMKLDARVQGDDGEIYASAGSPPRQSGVPFHSRLARWLGRLLPRGTRRAASPSLPFRVGDIVQDSWGNRHTIIAIDMQAEHGMGVIRTRRGDDTEHLSATIAHGFVVAKSGPME